MTAYTIDDIADMLNVSVARVNQLRSEGRLPKPLGVRKQNPWGRPRLLFPKRATDAAIRKHREWKKTHDFYRPPAIPMGA